MNLREDIEEIKFNQYFDLINWMRHKESRTTLQTLLKQ